MDPAKYPSRYIHRCYGCAWAAFVHEGHNYAAEWDEHHALTVTNEKHDIMPNDHPVVVMARKFYAKMNENLERSMRPL